MRRGTRGGQQHADDDNDPDRHRVHERADVGRRVSHRRLGHALHAIVLGAYLLSRPTHTTVVYVNSAPYYYTDGTYYVKKSNSVYVTVPPPSGAEIKTLPDGTVTVQFEGQDYSYYLGTFYIESGDQYQVVTAPVGATVTYAPKGAKKKTIDGTTYQPYQKEGVTLYRVVG